jgi:hypothetical protein
LFSSLREKLTIAVPIALILMGLPVIAPVRSALAAPPEPIKIAWKTPVNRPLSISMSAGGQFCGIVEQGGVVKVFGQKGNLLWKQKVTGATDVMVARNGQSVLVYSKLNPIYQEVNFFKVDGRKLWTHHVRGCIWSGAVSADGMRAAVTTGERYLYLYEPDPHRPTYRRWRLRGIGYSVAFAPDNARVITATYQKPTLASYDLRGKQMWCVDNDSERQFDLRISADSKSILGTIPATPYHTDAEVRFWHSDGKLAWKQVLSGGYEAHALVSPQSQYVAVSYADSILSRKGKKLTERKVAVYRSDGRLLWQKGGLFFGPHLMALSPTGSSVIVSDGAHSVYNIDQNGRVLSRLDVKASIREAMSTEDGRKILMYCGDGWLYLMSVG